MCECVGRVCEAAAVQVCDDCAVVHGCESLKLPSECISVGVGCCDADDQLTEAAHFAFAAGYGERVSVHNDRTLLNCPLYSAVGGIVCCLAAYGYGGAVRCDGWREGAVPVRIIEGLIPVVVNGLGLVLVHVVSDGLI